jgi:thiamine-phosphate pyrophosphorylase
LGLQVLAEIASEVSVPIFAIGGINSQNARACLDAGAYGVAAIGAAWDGDERRRLLRAVGDV